MIIVDTNVFSKLMSRIPSPAVVTWLGSIEPDDLYTTAVTVAEIQFGLAMLPPGQRRFLLTGQYKQFVARGVEHRVLPYDAPAAHAYADIRAVRRALGRPISVLDAQLAAIARSNGYAVATRNTRDFDECGVPLIDPFG